MNRVRSLLSPWYRRAVHALTVALLIVSCLNFSPSPAWAQKKKKEEAAPTKSYVLPYMIVLMMVSVGLMTVCRPGKRQERPEEKKPVK